MDEVTVWPGPNGPGYVNLFVNSPNDDRKKNGGKPWVIGWPFKDYASSLSASPGSARGATTSITSGTGRPCSVKPAHHQASKPKAVRKAANVTLVKSLWIDCDVKPQPADWDAG